LGRAASAGSPGSTRSTPECIRNSSQKTPLAARQSAYGILLKKLVVFDHAKSQLPEAITKRVLERWRFLGRADFQGPPRPATAGFIYTAFHTATQEIRQHPVPFGSIQKKARRS